MTNREKFKEVFGIDIPSNEHFFCSMIAETECDKCGKCEECKAFDWWYKEYVGAPSIKPLYVASMHPSPIIWNDIHEKMAELRGIVKLLRFAESLDDKVASKEIIKFCANDIEEITGGKKK